MDLDDKLDAFYKDTRIWPLGRDMPAAMCGGRLNIESLQMDAYHYWKKVRERNNPCRACRGQESLRAVQGSCPSRRLRQAGQNRCREVFRFRPQFMPSMNYSLLG